MRTVLAGAELLGFAALVVAGFLVAPALGFAVLGASLIVIGNMPLPPPKPPEEGDDHDAEAIRFARWVRGQQKAEAS